MHHFYEYKLYACICDELFLSECSFGSSPLHIHSGFNLLNHFLNGLMPRPIYNDRAIYKTKIKNLFNTIR